MDFATKPLILQDAALGGLQHIPQPPKQLFVYSTTWTSLVQSPKIAVIGSRKTTAYGRAVTEQLVQQLVRAGVVIISGLALGIDSIAHQTCLAAGGQTIAILPSGLGAIYPAAHQQLATRIVQQGGALVSEYGQDFRAQKWTFIERNRLVSGLADALLVTEAAEKSGTLHTAGFALDQGRPVLAVPGNITSPTSAGTNSLIHSGATPVLHVNDLLEALGLVQTLRQVAPTSTNPHEQHLINLLAEGYQDGGELLARSQLSIQVYNQAITMLEISGIVQPLGGNQWRLSTG